MSLQRPQSCLDLKGRGFKRLPAEVFKGEMEGWGQTLFAVEKICKSAYWMADSLGKCTNRWPYLNENVLNNNNKKKKYKIVFLFCVSFLFVRKSQVVQASLYSQYNQECPWILTFPPFPTVRITGICNHIQLKIKLFYKFLYHIAESIWVGLNI